LRTVTFKSVFESILRQLGMDPRGDAVSTDAGLSISDNLNDRVNTAWFAWEWPEWTITEERAFRQIWNNSRQFYQVAADGEPDEVFYIPNVATASLVDAAYYRVKTNGSGDPPLGVPPTNTTYWEPMDTVDTYVAFDQACRRRIGEVIDVFANNPATCKPPRQLPHRVNENGIQVYEAGGLPTVFVRYLIPAERFTTFPYIASRTYLRGDMVYVADQGECYQAIVTAMGHDPATEFTYWRRCLFPAVLAKYVQLGTYADCLRESNTSDERDPVMLQIRGQNAGQAASDAEDEINRQINRLQAQGQNFQYLPFGVVLNRGGRGALCSVPGYVLQGGGAYNYGPIAPTGSGVTTIDDRCETEWGYIPPPPPPVTPDVPGEGLDVESGITALVAGQAYIDVVFLVPQDDANWIFVECGVVNTSDSSPLNIVPGIVTSKTTTGFRLQLSGLPDTANYYLHWAISEVSAGTGPTTPATSYSLSAPTSGGIGLPSTPFAVQLPVDTSVPTPVTVTPSDGGGGGTFTPASVTLTTATPSASFTYTPASYGAKTISVTNDGGLTDPGDRTFTCVATTYTLTGPSTGSPGVPSTNFTVALPAGGVVPATVTVMPGDGGGGGTFTPTTVNLTTAAPSATFTYTPASTGAKTISATNNGGLANPAPLTYTATSPVHLLNTLISYWKLDEASGTRADSVGTNNMIDTGGVTGVAAKINNGAFSSGASFLSCAGNPTLQVTSDFTVSCWVRVDDPATLRIILAKAPAALAPADYMLRHHPTLGFIFTVNATNLTVGAPAVAMSIHHLVAWYDSSDTFIRLRVDDATTYVSGSIALVQGTDPLGLLSSGFGTSDWVGWIDEVGFWKRKLAAEEITALYNGGAGLPFSSFTS
jgi:hypothetical protein